MRSSSPARASTLKSSSEARSIAARRSISSRTTASASTCATPTNSSVSSNGSIQRTNSAGPASVSRSSSESFNGTAAGFGRSQPPGRARPSRSRYPKRQEEKMDDREVEILLVEDNESDLELTLRALRKVTLANKFSAVRDGAEALDYLFATGEYSERDGSAHPRVVLLDLKLPKVEKHYARVRR